MKRKFIFLFCAMAIMPCFAQTPCNDAQSDAVYAFSHIQTAMDANNFTHLKQYSKRSMEAFARAKVNLENCDCNDVYNVAYDAHEILKKVATSEKFEDGRYYANKAQKMAQQILNDLDSCTGSVIVADNSGSDDLNELEAQQLQLVQQQEELKRKAIEIKARLAAQQEQAQLLKKEQLILESESVISSNLKAYNKSLTVCACNTEVSSVSQSKAELLSKSEGQIRTHYIKSLKDITTNYLSKLDQCSTN